MQFCDCGRHRPGRRAFLGAAATVALGCAAAGVAPIVPALGADPVARTMLTPDQALRLLKEGNESFRADAPFHGVGVLGCPLIVVLGHEACGAVAAALDVVDKNATFPGVIGEMVQPIIPAVLESRRMSGGTPLDNAVTANAKRVAARLGTQSQVIHEALRGGKLKIVAARYDLDDGKVDFFE